MFLLIRLVVSLLLRACIYLIIGSSILTFIGALLRPPWIEHPVVLAVVAIGNALVRPFRKLMQWLGIPTRPIDFSPILAILFFELLLSLVSAFR